MALSSSLRLRAPPACRRAGPQRAAAAARAPLRVVAAAGKVVLEVKGLTAKIASSGLQILNGVNLTIREGEVHAIMGKNGSGKSTLSKVLVGHPDYEVTGGSATFKGQDLFALEPEKRSHLGMFLSFQSPIEVPGVSNIDFLRMASNARRKAEGKKELDPLEFYAFVMPKARLNWEGGRGSSRLDPNHHPPTHERRAAWPLAVGPQQLHGGLDLLGRCTSPCIRQQKGGGNRTNALPKTPTPRPVTLSPPHPPRVPNLPPPAHPAARPPFPHPHPPHPPLPVCPPPQLEMLNMDAAFLNRNVNEGFSGGEKKRNEILQLAVLEVCVFGGWVGGVGAHTRGRGDETYISNAFRLQPIHVPPPGASR
jgi:Fe-S cluster assembly ATPase SufC